MIAVSDSGPLHYLILIDYVSLLPDLFDKIVIPQAVFSELSHDRAPRVVSDWLINPPQWLEITVVKTTDTIKSFGKGEWEAIPLSMESYPDQFLLMDDHGARAYAERLGIRVIGTLGILFRASQILNINLNEAIDKLLKTIFRSHPRLIKSILRDV